MSKHFTFFNKFTKYYKKLTNENTGYDVLKNKNKITSPPKNLKGKIYIL